MREVTPPTIHTVITNANLHWYLGIFNFILRIRLTNKIRCNCQRQLQNSNDLLQKENVEHRQSKVTRRDVDKK